MKRYENLTLVNGIWYFEFWYQNVRHKRSCRTPSIKEAQRVLREYRTALEADSSAPSAASPRAPMLPDLDTMAAWDMARARRKGSSVETIEKGLKYTWKRVREFFKSMHEVCDASLLAFVDHQLASGRVPQTIKRDLWAIVRAYKHIRREFPQLPELHELPELANAPKNKNAGVVWSLEFLQSWLGHLPPAPRDKALVALHTGIRAHELKHLDMTWIERHPHTKVAHFVTIPAGKAKGRTERTVGIPPHIMPLLTRGLPYGTNFQKAFAIAARKAGAPKNVTLRDLRHTFASHVSHVDPDGVRLVMGHTQGDKGSAMFYQHISLERAAKVALGAAQVFAPLTAALP